MSNSFRLNYKFGGITWIGPVSPAVEPGLNETQVTNIVRSLSEPDLSVDTLDPKANVIKSNVDLINRRTSINFNRVYKDKCPYTDKNGITHTSGGFWYDAVPGPEQGYKNGIRVDNKPQYNRGIYKFNGNIYLTADNPAAALIGTRVLYISALFFTLSGIFLVAFEIWKDVKLAATIGDLPLGIQKDDFVIDVPRSIAQVSALSKVPANLIQVILTLQIAQDSGSDLKYTSAQLSFTKISEIPDIT